MTNANQVNEPVPTYADVPYDAEANLKGSLQAMRRAALRARQVAQQTGTDLIVVRSGQVVRVSPKQKTTP